jgi:Ca2+-binding EF-hand superfamily protein
MKLSTLLVFAAGVSAGYFVVAPVARAFAEAPPDASFEGMDLDHDGSIDAAEHAAAAKRMYATMDRNADGKVSATEMDAAQVKVTGRKPGKGAMRSFDKIRAIDQNGDRVLSAAEHESGAALMFARRVKDRDGRLSRAEFDAGHAGLEK